MTDLTHIIAEWRESGTPGPWMHYTREGSMHVRMIQHADRPLPLAIVQPIPRKWPNESIEANADFITSAPAMADRIEALEAENARLRKTVEASAMLGNIVGWLGDDIDRIEALKAAMEPGLIERARAALNKEGG